MCPIGWKPEIRKIEQLIQEEEARTEVLKQQKQATSPWQPQTVPEFAPTNIKVRPFAVPPIISPTPPPIPPLVPTEPSTPSYVPPPKITAPIEKALSIEQIGQQYEWWEKPKEVTEKLMSGVGQGVSKIPVLPKALEFIAPAFEFIHENLEKPWASILTAPFSPSLPWQGGEGWLEHQKREYDTWKAPTYIKGITEFSMPLWWMPWFTWIKGAKAAAIGEKVARGIKVGEKLTLPSKEVLNAGYKDDWFRSLAHWSENKPVIGSVVKAVGGEAAFARSVGEVYQAMDIPTRRLVVVNKANVRVPVTDVVRREIVNRAILEDMKHGYKGLQLPRMQALASRGDLVKALQVDDFGRIMAAIPKEGNDLGRGMSEVFGNPDLYTFATPQAEAIVKEGRKILDELFDLAKTEGVRPPGGAFFHRLVEGKNVTIGDKTIYEASEYGAKFEVARHYKTMEEGIKAGVVYGRDPLKSIAATMDYYFRRIATHRYDTEVGKLGMTIPEMVSLVEPDLIEKMATLGTQIGSASYLVKTLTTLKAYKGDYIPGAVVSKIRRGMPDSMERIEQVFSLNPAETTKLMDSLAKDIGKATKLKSKDLRILIAQYSKTPGHILVREIDDMVKSLNLTSEMISTTLRKIYKNAYQFKKEQVDEVLKSVRVEAEELLKTAKSELTPLKQQYSRISLPYREGTGQIFGGYAKFQMHPAFRNRIFDEAVIKLAESHMGKQGSQWVRNMAQVSGIGRLAVAALDFSAPFIQGLAVLGRNPVEWAGAVGQQFRFFAKPDDFFQYMVKPEVRALAAERWMYGGSRSSFEFFEALAPVQRAAEKTPRIGGNLKRGIQETYGRAEIAFSGFGEVARNNMWEALRVKAIQPGGGLDTTIARDLARSIDRMTGVMSTEALGIKRGQVDFENAFVFFAPRYTRASLSYVADIMKGGIAGAEARKGLGALMAAGASFYYGVTTALGQRPDFNINSPTFMTVKIGNDHLGVGGMLYSLARLQANIIGTAIENPVDFTTLSRFDNPFIKFMYSRSSALTGLVGNIVEQKNYFGEPLEDIGSWGKFMAEKALPIAMQRAILEPEHRNPIVFVGELTGMRTFPKGAWELQEEAKDRLSQSEFGLSYENLDLLQKRQIDKHPDVAKFQEEVDQQVTRRGKALSVAFLERGRDLEDARFLHREAVENLARAFDAGVITGVEFKDGVNDANTGYGATLEHINRNPRYTNVMAKLAEPRDVSREYRWELAYDELVVATSGNKFEDSFGIFDFDAYNQFLEQVRLKYGDADFEKARQMQQEKYAEYPPLFQELQRAKEIMRPYWEVRTRVIKLFGEKFADSPSGQSLISKIRKGKRLSNPDIERSYQRFYAG